MVPLEDPATAFKREQEVMAAYSETAKTYTQLSLGALVLSVTFMERVGGYTHVIPVNAALLIAWIAWLVATLAGAAYQYFAVRFLEARGEEWGLLDRGGHPQAFPSLAKHPWKVYTVLLAAFYLGALAFTAVGITQLSDDTTRLPGVEGLRMLGAALGQSEIGPPAIATEAGLSGWALGLLGHEERAECDARQSLNRT